MGTSPSHAPTRSPTPLAGARLASVPAGGLSALAMLRGRPDVAVRFEGDRAWVAWDPGAGPGADDVLAALLPTPGAAFFRFEGGRWYRVGRRLPAFDVEPPDVEASGVPLHRALLPEPIRWESPRRDWAPARLALVRDPRPRPASALRTTARALLGWAESAPTALLGAFRASRSGDRVLLVGRRPPVVPGAERFWGRRVLLPLGYRAEPELPEDAMAEALGLGAGSIGLVGPGAGVEVVPAEALATLSRAAARLMAGVGPGDRIAADGGASR